MCDTVVAVPPATADGAVWFGKNSDREPGEAQAVEHVPAARHPEGATVQCTYVALPQVRETHEVVLSRPFWGWGCEMGANARGLVLGNEAVFTRMPVAETGLTGMDLQRLALERTASAREALELITRLIAEPGQGGAAGYRNKRFRYHNAFILADPSEAWVLETAGPFWAAERVRGVRTISNVLTIGKEPDLVHPGAADFARKKGWLKSGQDFDFARCFGDPFYRVMTGGELRRACTAARLTGRVSRETVLATLRDHGGRSPLAGLRLEMPCAHASFLPTRHAGQTTGALVSRLTASGALHWLTGTSSPCLSVFKPVVLGAGPVDTGASPGGGYDPASLFWRHEHLHRLVLGDYDARRALFEAERVVLEARALAEVAPTAAACSELWAAHRESVLAWTDRVERAPHRRAGPLFSFFWRRHARLDGLPRARRSAHAGADPEPRA